MFFLFELCGALLVMLFIVQAHLKGKRYKQQKAKAMAEKFDFEQYAPDIVQSKKDPKKLFCHYETLLPCSAIVFVKVKKGAFPVMKNG